MTRLMLTFVNGNGNRVSLSVPQPKPNLSEAEVREAMDEIVDADLLRPGSSSLVAPHVARVVSSSSEVIHRA